LFAAVALELAKAGAKVVVAGRRESEGQTVVKAIEKIGGKAMFVRTDVSREAELKALVDKTLDTFGRLDFAFNNAGVEGTPGLTTGKQTEENYRRTFDINVLGVLLSMKHEIPAILKNGGAIVNTSSVAGQIGMPGLCVCCRQACCEWLYAVGCPGVCETRGARERRGLRAQSRPRWSTDSSEKRKRPTPNATG
jgi:NAD(P)-dependent dehydrogenase (short-subunit alcohol dehydrogenase family)